MPPEIIIPNPPEGSWFQLDRDERGRQRLSWQEPFTWGGFLLTAAIVLGFTGFLVWLLRPMLELAPRLWADFLRDGPPDNVFLAALMIVALLIATAGNAALVLTPGWMIYAALRPPRPSRLTFGKSELRYEHEGFSKLRWHVRELERAQLGEVRIDSVEEAPGQPERQRLTVDHGAERIEIGHDLRPEDRQWLAGAIREWIGERVAAATPSLIPDPLANSAITVERGEEGRLLLRWKPEFPGGALGAANGRWMQLMHLSAWLFGWTIGEVVVTFMVIAILGGHWAGWGGIEFFMLAVMLVWLPGWTCGGVMAMRQWWGLFRGPGVERLELTPASLYYRPGRVFDAATGTFRKEQPREVPLAEIGRIQIERTDRRERLTVDRGAERFEIGPNLREPEREWLARLLDQWAYRGQRVE